MVAPWTLTVCVSSVVEGCTVVNVVWVCVNLVLFSPRQQKARDNRAAQRINKVQLSNDPLKRHVPSQPPPPGPYDPVSIEMEAGFKDPLRPKESEQELEWKLRQVGVSASVFTSSAPYIV